MRNMLYLRTWLLLLAKLLTKGSQKELDYQVEILDNCKIGRKSYRALSKEYELNGISEGPLY